MLDDLLSQVAYAVPIMPMLYIEQFLCQDITTTSDYTETKYNVGLTVGVLIYPLTAVTMGICSKHT